MKYSEFVIDDLFVSHNGNVDIQKNDINGKGEPVITSGVDNYGIAGKSDVPANVFDANTITVDMFGNAFFRPFKYKMVTHARVFNLEFKQKTLDEKLGLYITSSLSYLTKVFSYNNMCSFNKIKDMTIVLPITNKKDKEQLYSQDGYMPDFNYMQERINELEQERINELEQYLIASGLNDYKLTKKDIETLSLSSFRRFEESDNKNVNRNVKEIKEFKLKDIVELSSSKKRFDANKVNVYDYEKGYPYVVRTSKNNGIKGYIDEDKAYLNEKNTFSFGQDTATIFWQEKPYFTGDKIKVLKPVDKINNNVALYILSMMRNAFNDFNWGAQSFNENIIKDMNILLPILEKDNAPIIDRTYKYHEKGFVPDYDYMNRYIKVVEKIVIKKVVDYKDETIKYSKKAI